MGVGRFICVGMPFAMTVAALVAVLIAGLAGVTSTNIPLVSISTKNLSISIPDFNNFTAQVSSIQNTGSVAENNITAKQLGLADSYDFYLFAFASTTNGVWTKNASSFDYARNFNSSTAAAVAAANGADSKAEVAVPQALGNAVVAFTTLLRWTEIMFIAGCALVGVALILGLVGFKSRVASCCTYIVMGFATTAMIAFGALGTVTIFLVYGVFQAGQRFGVSSVYGRTWLILVWAANALLIVGGMFWLFSACCCKSEHRKSSRSEKPHGHYERVVDPFVRPVGPAVHQGPAPSYAMGNVQHSGAYEPYSHHG